MSTHREYINAFFDNFKKSGLIPATNMPQTENKVCVHRGKYVGGCSCGAEKYICGILGIEVRDKKRPGHDSDIVCGEICPEFKNLAIAH